MKTTKEESRIRDPKNASRRALMRGAVALAGGTATSVLTPALLAASEVQPAVPSATPGVVVATSPRRNIVDTEGGKVFGFVRNGIVTFKGIPYGASTEGKNRFMPPVKPIPWMGVRSALYWGPVSPQIFTSTFEGRRGGWNHDDESFMFEWDDGQPAEDCLRINVWTPSISDNQKRPVLVWLHGGGFTSGSDHELRMYDGESLSRYGDVVMVSLNHRLGVLGFMDLMDYGDKWAASSNVGMLDIVAGLEWVKTNISNFGGDPGKVLIFGQSGGGGKVGALMGMPSAKGLFQRAVIQSGSGLRQNTHDHSALLAAAVIAELGLTKDTLDKLQDFRNEKIVQAGLRAQRMLAATTGGHGGFVGGGWGPVVDGKIIPRHSWDPDAPSQSADVPLMVGTVLNEMTNSVQMGDASLDAMDINEVRGRLTAQRGDKANAILTAFQKAHPKATPFELLSRITAMGARINAITQAERKTAQKTAPAFVYWFQWQTPVLDGRPRAFHCSELPFVFYNTDRCATMTGGGPETRALSSKIADAWVNFAQKGDPNHAGLPQWPAYTAEQGPTMIFDAQCVLKNNPDAEERKAITS